MHVKMYETHACIEMHETYVYEDSIQNAYGDA